MIDADEAVIAVRPYTRFLDRAGDDGIKLTGAGRLPPAVVTETMAVLEDRVEWIGKANREEHTLPVSSCARRPDVAPPAASPAKSLGDHEVDCNAEASAPGTWVGAELETRRLKSIL